MAFIGNQIITINSLLDLDGQELVLDADADSTIHVSTDDQIDFKIGGTDVVTFTNSSSDFVITQAVQDKDIIFKGDDGGSAITALTLDMSEAGAATFNNKIIATELDISGDIDVDGTANLDAIDVDGTANFAADVTFADGADIITATAGTSNFRAGLNAGNSIQSGGVQNVAIGDEAGTAITTGDNNVCIGYQAGDAISTGDNNIAIGKNALGAEDGHDFNIAIGSNSLAAQDAGADAYNIAIGHNAGTSITTGVQNTLIGGQAGDAITDADFNVGVGHNALSVNVLGSQSVAIGHNALLFQNPASATDMANVAVGYGAGSQITTGIQNTILGGSAGDALTTGNENVAIGMEALTSDTQGKRSVAVGKSALLTQNLSSSANAYNTAVGYDSGRSVTTGVNNIIIGALAGDALTDADFNVAMGFQALTNDTLGSGSTAIGHHALQTQNFTSATSSLNVAVGYQAGKAVTTAIANTLVGNQAGLALTTGNNNVVMGHAALLSEVQGDLNTAIGVGALQNQVNSSDADVNNTAVGYNAGNAVTSGTKNTLIGAGSGNAITSGDGNVVIGSYNGNENSLDIRTLDNNIVLSDGDGNPRLLITSGGDITNNVGNVSSFSRQNAGFTARNGDSVSISRNNGTPLEINRIGNDGTLIDFRQADSSEGSISVSGSTVSLSGFQGSHESSGIATDTPIGTVVSTIDALDTYASGSKAGQTRADHAKVKISDSVGDKRIYGVVSKFDDNDKVFVASVGIGSVLVTGACAGGDLLESNGDGTAKVQSDDVIKSKTIGKVTIGNSDAGVKLVSCVLYCG